MSIRDLWTCPEHLSRWFPARFFRILSRMTAFGFDEIAKQRRTYFAGWLQSAFFPAAMSSPVYLIYLLRRDLRVADNPIFNALSLATRNSNSKFTHLLPLYIIPPRQIEVSGFLSSDDTQVSPYPEARSRLGKFWRCGPHRAKFLAECLWDLKTTLKSTTCGGNATSDLVIRIGHMHEVVRELLSDTEFGPKVGAVWMTRDWASEEMEEEKQIRRVVSERGNVDWKVWDGEEMLIHDDDIPNSVSEVSDVFTAFRKTVEPLSKSIRLPFSDPISLPPFPDIEVIPPQSKPFSIPDSLESLIHAFRSPLEMTMPSHPSDAKSAHPFLGGETAAHSRLQHLFETPGLFANYKNTRNGLLGADFSMKLSAYLALGCISARQVNAYLVAYENGTAVDGGPSPDSYSRRHDGYGKGQNPGTTSIRFELLWRDYMRLCMRKYGTSLFSVHGYRGPPSQQAASRWLGLDSAEGSEKFQRFQYGTTGTGLIDASMRELYLTGYTSNRTRQNCASFLAKWLGIDWRLGAEWYESMLVDHDVASNWGNWQYVAGVGNDPRGREGEGRKFNPVKQGWDYDPEGIYVSTWVEEVRDVKDVDIRLQVWKALDAHKTRRERGVEDQKQSEALKRLGGLNWVMNPLVKIEYKRRRPNTRAYDVKPNMK